MSQAAIKRVRLFVTGRVQGVYYRASTRQQAHRLGVAGWVRNTADGAVEVEAQGTPEAVDALVNWCRHGPPGARVASVDVTELAAGDGENGDFAIRY